MKIHVSAVCPVRDEEKNISYIFNSLKPFGAATEVIFVEGGSKDNTWEEIQKLHNSQNKYGVFFRTKKQKGFGKAGAVETGFSAARGKYLIIVDADLSINQKNLQKILQLFTQYGDNILASGNRLKGIHKPKSFYWINYIGNYFFRYYYSLILQTKIFDISCGTKAMTKRTWEKVKKLRFKNKKLDMWGDIDWLFYSKKAGAKIVFVAIDYFPRRFGQSKLQNIKTRWKFAIDMFCIGIQIIFLNKNFAFVKLQFIKNIFKQNLTSTQ